MKYLLDMLRNLRMVIEDDPAVQPSELSELVSDLDTRTRLLLEQLNYDPKKVPHADLFRQTPDARKAEAEKHFSMLKSDPCRLLPYAVNCLSHDISDRVSRDLLMHVGDIFFSGQRFRFNISTASFGMSFSSRSPVSDKLRIENRLKELQEMGLKVCGGKHKDLDLPLCDANVEFLTKYCEQILHGKVMHIESLMGIINKVHVSLDPEEYIPEESTDDIKTEKVLDEDARAVLAKNIRQTENAVCSYQSMAAMGHGDLILETILGSVFDIEDVTGLHFQVYEDKMRTLESIRKMNSEIFDLQETIGREFLKTVLWTDVKNACSAFQDEINRVLKPAGLFIDQFRIGQYQRQELILHPDALRYHSIGLDPSLDIVVNDQIGVSIQDSDSNLEKIMLLLRKPIPEVELGSFETSVRGGRRSIRSMTVSWVGLFPA